MFYTFTQNSNAYLVTLETLGSPRGFKIKFCGFEQCLAAQHGFVFNSDATAGKSGLRGYISNCVVCLYLLCAGTQLAENK